MAILQRSVLILGFLFLLLGVQPSHSLTCSSQKFTKNRLYDNCNDLPQLSSYLHWTYDASDSSLHVAFIAPPAKPGGWIAWAINPNGTGMVGAQSLIAFKKTDGSMTVKPFKLISYKSIQQTKIAYDVSNMEAEYVDGIMRIFATVALPEKLTVLNQIWQVGSSVVNGTPAVHEFQPANLNSKGTLDLVKGQSSTSNGDSRLRKRNIHGVLNTVSWGILLPIGIMTARYLRMFKFADPAWFYIHVTCQFSSYVVGVAGWATGLKLGSQSKGVQYTSHRDIGIALFCLATLQVFALFLRPKKDHKYRFYWNIYHHGVGYAVLILGIINVFKGLEILDPAKKWKAAYIVLLAVLGGISLLLEVITWIVVLKRKSDKSTKPYDGFNGSNGTQQPLAT